MPPGPDPPTVFTAVCVIIHHYQIECDCSRLIHYRQVWISIPRSHGGHMGLFPFWGSAWVTVWLGLWLHYIYGIRQQMEEGSFCRHVDSYMYLMNEN